MQRWCRPVSPDVTLDDHYSRSGTALAILRRTRHHHRHHEPACTTSAYTKKSDSPGPSVWRTPGPITLASDSGDTK